MTLRFTCINIILSDHISDVETPSELAGLADIPPDQLQQIVWQGAGCTVEEYIRRVRVREMIRHLQTTDASVDEAGFLAGFESEREAIEAFLDESGDLRRSTPAVTRTSRTPRVPVAV